MAAIDDIIKVRSYEGDAKAGGSFTQAITFDLTPFERLNAYTVAANRDAYERKNKLDDEAAVKIGELTALDISSADPLEVAYFDKKKKLILDKAKNGGLYYQENPKAFIELKQEYSDFVNEKTRTNANTITRLQWQDLIDNAIGVDKDELTQRRDQAVKEFNDGGIENALKTRKSLKRYNPITENSFTLPKYDQAFTTQTEDVIEDNNKKIKIIYNDPNSVDNAINTDWVKYSSEVFVPSKEAQSDPNKLSIEKLDFEKKNKPFKEVQASTQKFNQFIAPYKEKLAAVANDDVKFEEELKKINIENGGGLTMILEIVKANHYFNKDVTNANAMQQMQAAKDGKPIPTPIRGINILDDLTPQEYLKGNTVYGKKIISTYTEDLTANDARLKREQMASSERINRDDNANARYLARLSIIPKKVKDGKATAEELAEYPIAKTKELQDAIPTNGIEFNLLTPEQKLKIQTQIGSTTIDDKSVITISGDKLLINSTEKKGGWFSKEIIPKIETINLDDITKNYYDEINKNDAGKESVKRIKYTQSLFNLDDTKNQAELPSNAKAKQNSSNKILSQEEVDAAVQKALNGK